MSIESLKEPIAVASETSNLSLEDAVPVEDLRFEGNLVADFVASNLNVLERNIGYLLSRRLQRLPHVGDDLLELLLGNLARNRTLERIRYLPLS